MRRCASFAARSLSAKHQTRAALVSTSTSKDSELSTSPMRCADEEDVASRTTHHSLMVTFSAEPGSRSDPSRNPLLAAAVYQLDAIAVGLACRSRGVVGSRIMFR